MSDKVFTDAQVVKACGAVAEALGDALDCLRAWSAWSVGTMGPNDFSPVSDDTDRVLEITEAALNVAAAEVESLRQQIAQRDAEIERLTALVPKPDADGWFTWNRGACPVPDDTQVEVRHPTGSVDQGRADKYNWHRYGTIVDVVAYRVIEGGAV